MIHCSLGQFIEIAAKILYAVSSKKNREESILFIILRY